MTRFFDLAAPFEDRISYKYLEKNRVLRKKSREKTRSREKMAQVRMGDHESEAITYGDVFKAKGNLAKQPVTPGDAALMQSAETLALGQTQKGGVAALMEAAAQANEKAGLVSKDDDTVARAEGMMVTETTIPSRKVTVECVGGQVVSSDVQPSPAAYATAAASYVTIGDALEAAALTTWDKPVEQSDAAAIQSAVRRATGTPEMLPGGVGAAAQSAADINTRLPYEERTTLADILFTAAEDLPADKVVIMEDAQKIKESEARQSVTGEVFPGGVGDAMEAAARMNEQDGLNIAR